MCSRHKAEIRLLEKGMDLCLNCALKDIELAETLANFHKQTIINPKELHFFLLFHFGLLR